MKNKTGTTVPNGVKFDGTRKCDQCKTKVHRTFKAGDEKWCQKCAKEARIV